MVPPMIRAQSAVTVVAIALFGCASKTPQAPDAPEAERPTEPSPSEPVPASEPAPPEAPCASDDDCADKAKTMAESGDDAGAVALYKVGCEANGARSCVGWAIAVAKDDPALALSLQEKACDLDNYDGCFNAAEKYRESDPVKAVGLYAKSCRPDGDAFKQSLTCGRGALAAYAIKEYDKARVMAEVRCTDSVTGGCGLLGVMYAQGTGVSADLDRAKSLLDKGCKGGDKEACGNLEKVAAAAAQSRLASVLPVDGANVSIGSISVDGLSASDLKCRRDGGGGLFGGAMGAISGISKRKGKLMKCAKAPEDVRVRWKASGGKIKTVEVKASSTKVETCVKKAVKGASAAFGGTCAATFSIG